MASASGTISRMPAIAAIRASVLSHLLQQIDRKTGKTDILLATHGILRTQLDDPYGMVPMARYVALFEEAALLTGETALGARIGTMFQPSDIGPIGVLFSISSSIRVGFERLARYVKTVQGATSSGIFEEHGNLVWSYRLVDPLMWPRRQDSEFTLAASCQLVRACFSRSWKPVEVHFEHAGPRTRTALEQIFRAPLKFGESANRIVISGEDAARLYRQEDAALAAVLERHIADIAGSAPSPDTISEKVRSLIGIYIGHRPITVAAIAADLNCAPRTLQRRLSGEGTSLRDLVREYRRTLASLHLQDGDATMKGIAATLGYADETVFWRARRSWR